MLESLSKEDIIIAKNLYDAAIMYHNKQYSATIALLKLSQVPVDE
jgi:hypothetical protein